MISRWLGWRKKRVLILRLPRYGFKDVETANLSERLVERSELTQGSFFGAFFQRPQFLDGQHTSDQSIALIVRSMVTCVKYTHQESCKNVFGHVA